MKNSFEFLKNLKEKNEEVILFNFFEMNNSSLNFKENNQVIKGDKLKLSKINQTQINFDCCFKTETTLNQIQQIFDLKLNLFYLHYFIFLNLNN